MDLLFALQDLNVTLDIWRRAAYATGGLAFFLLASILTTKVKLAIRASRLRTLTRLWQSIVGGGKPRDHAGSPSLAAIRRRRMLALSLWNDSYDDCRSDATAARLIDLAQSLSLHDKARSLLHSRRLHRLLLAVRTLGRLRDQAAWSKLEELLSHPNPFVALHAAHALLAIDAKAAIPSLIPLLGHRLDWSPLAVATVLRTAGSDLASETLAKAATTGNTIVGPRLIRHLPVTQSPAGLPILRRLLVEQKPASPDMLAACLFALGEFEDPADLPLIRRYLFHPVWYVRVQAAAALGKLGTDEDEARLVALLNDQEWWVRYRAGEALITLRSMTENKLEALQETLPMPEAQEILATALARFRQRQTTHSLPQSSEYPVAGH
ncbi:MAG: HEAT repeat domain-containing protein [Nitrospira sp.]|nr:HEAT repeat domain-containing protein [Nitrospira sp.]MCP9443137.1 HEAT repeat domain-containing protein [Nitrospira sp.]